MLRFPIKNPRFIAPMAGVTNSAFRTIVKELGAELVSHGNGLYKGNPIQQRKTLAHASSMRGENPVSIQLLVAMKTASHTRSRIHPKKTLRPISSISTWAVQLIKS